MAYKFVVSKDQHSDVFISDIVNGRTIYNVEHRGGKLQINFTDRTHMEIEPRDLSSLVVIV